MSASDPEDTPPFFTRYGFSRPTPARPILDITPYPEICLHGTLRATVLASAVDLVGGLCTREVAGVDATFTSDLSLRIPDPGCPARLTATGTRLRAGSRLVTTAVAITVDDTPWAFGETTFARIARETPDVGASLERLSTPTRIPNHPLDRPLDQAVGIETVDATAGHVRLPLRSALRNPEGVLQGALVALLVECAALSRADAAIGRPHVLSELDLRYLAAAARGPVESETCWIGDARDGLLRVLLRDRGHENRITTTALARVVPASR